jgi:hypothetical protein
MASDERGQGGCASSISSRRQMTRGNDLDLSCARGQEQLEGAETGEEWRRRHLGGYGSGSAMGVGRQRRSDPNPSRHRLDTGGLGGKWQDLVPIRCGVPLIYPVAIFYKSPEVVRIAASFPIWEAREAAESSPGSLRITGARSVYSGATLVFSAFQNVVVCFSFWFWISKAEVQAQTNRA